MNLIEFEKKFGTDQKCLDVIRKMRFPDCPECRNKLYPIKGRTSYACRLGHHTSPLSGTIFEKSTTPLTQWFLAMFLMSSTRSGISAKTLERILGVTYKTAWRMFKQIRILMNEDIKSLSGEVEVDETWIGGKNWFKGKKWWSNYKDRPKSIILGMIERRGRVKTQVIEDVDWKTLTSQVMFNVRKGSRILTDGYHAYRRLPKAGYRHDWINHMVHYTNKKKPDIHTQNIESFWGQMKRGITGTYRHVSKDYLMSYCNEYSFRHNHRSDVFEGLMSQLERSVLPFQWGTDYITK